MWPFGKKQPAQIGVPTEDPNALPKPEENKSDGGVSLQGADVGKIAAELEKMAGQMDSMREMQKAGNERFGRIGEQIGELRSMILDRDKSGKLIEAKALQAIDLVESVQPDKLMIEMRRADGKLEGLRATIEGHESIIKNVMAETKDLRTQLSLFKGLDEVVKLSQDIKKDMLAMQKINIDVERHADMVSSIFGESQRRFSDMDKFVDATKELDKGFKSVLSEFEGMKAKLRTLATKKEFDTLVSKFNDFEKHAGNVMLILNKKFSAVEDSLNKEFKEKITRVEKLVNGLQLMVQKTPELDKFFQILDKAATAAPAPAAAAEPEKVKQPGEDDAKKEEEKPAAKK